MTIPIMTTPTSSVIPILNIVKLINNHFKLTSELVIAMKMTKKEIDNTHHCRDAFKNQA